MKKSEAYYKAMQSIMLGDDSTDEKIEILDILMDDWKMAKWVEDQKEQKESE